MGKKGLAISIVTCLICIGLPLTWGGAVTLERVIYTLGKLCILLYRMFKGYDDGAKAYHTVEVKYLDSKSEYLEEFVIFVDEKTYMQIANEYTDINRILGLDRPGNGEKYVEIPCVKSDQERAGDGDLGGQLNPAPNENCA